MKSIENDKHTEFYTFPVLYPCDFCDDNSFYVECPVCRFENHVTFGERKVVKVTCECGVKGVANL